MSTTIIFATGNQGKMGEIRQIMGDMDVELLSMKEAGIESDVEETGTTFEENAILKARTVAVKTSHIVLADDSGLEIDHLNKEPGIYSARYMGEDTPYEVKNRNLLERLAGVEDDKRTARFVCAIAACFPDGKIITTEGVIEGRIAWEPAGGGGFGYDPIFCPKGWEKTFAEAGSDEKNAISHRGRATRKLVEYLKNQNS